ncbi:hypothetical protein VI06_17935 [Aquitalea magnusonii]|nr:hypothetical protein VI06_17935 [Aquitalea magnusonii]
MFITHPVKVGVFRLIQLLIGVIKGASVGMVAMLMVAGRLIVTRVMAVLEQDPACALLSIIKKINRVDSKKFNICNLIGCFGLLRVDVIIYPGLYVLFYAYGDVA